MKDFSSLIAQVPLGTLDSPSAQFGADDASTNKQLVLSSLESTISTLIGTLTVIAGIFFVIFFFLAAFKWQTAGGDASKVQKARDEMVQGVIGMILIIAAYGIIGIVGTILGLNLLNPSTVISNMLGGFAN